VTSHPIRAYGGIRLDEAIVARVAEAVSNGTLPMQFEHDISRPIDISNVVTGTERLEDGYLAAWSEFDVDEEVWDQFEREVEAAGAPGGMSASLTGPLDGETLATDSQVVVAADAHHFTDDDIRRAASELARLDPSAGGERLYQFSGVPEAKVVIDTVLALGAAVGTNILAAIIYDAAKGFLKRQRQRVVFNLIFRESRKGARKLQVHLEVASEEQLRTAFEGLPAILEGGAVGTFASTDGQALQPIESTSPAPDADRDHAQPKREAPDSRQ